MSLEGVGHAKVAQQLGLDSVDKINSGFRPSSNTMTMTIEDQTDPGTINATSETSLPTLTFRRRERTLKSTISFFVSPLSP